MSAPRRVGVAGLICWAVSIIAAFGWGNHWNAYTNLLLSLGDIVLWATLAVAVRASQTESGGASE